VYIRVERDQIQIVVIRIETWIDFLPLLREIWCHLIQFTLDLLQVIEMGLTGRHHAVQVPRPPIGALRYGLGIQIQIICLEALAVQLALGRSDKAIWQELAVVDAVLVMGIYLGHLFLGILGEAMHPLVEVIPSCDHLEGDRVACEWADAPAGFLSTAVGRWTNSDAKLLNIVFLAGVSVKVRNAYFKILHNEFIIWIVSLMICIFVTDVARILNKFIQSKISPFLESR
jgi:hypothetical protein